MIRVILIRPAVIGAAPPGTSEGFRVKLAVGTTLKLPDRLAQELVTAGLAKKIMERAVLEPPEIPEER
jgi:hypothetical protein